MEKQLALQSPQITVHAPLNAYGSIIRQVIILFAMIYRHIYYYSELSVILSNSGAILKIFIWQSACTRANLFIENWDPPCDLGFLWWMWYWELCSPSSVTLRLFLQIKQVPFCFISHLDLSVFVCFSNLYVRFSLCSMSFLCWEWKAWISSRALGRRYSLALMLGTTWVGLTRSILLPVE